MSPVKTNESNFVYRGPTPEIADLPCRLEGGDTFSVWELSPAERERIAAGGNLRLGIYGVRPIPPVSIQVVVSDGPWAKAACPCAVCGKECGDPVHDNGEGTHTFKVA